jgi:hypothetical protein
MEEVTIQPNCIPQPSLSTAYDIGKQIEAKQAEIDKLREDSGITKLEAEIHALDEAYTEIINNCIAAGIFEEGPLRLISKGGQRRKLIPEAFHKAYPQMFYKLASIPVSASENELVSYYESVCGLPKKEAKRKAKDEITSMSEMVGEPRYELINLTE